MLAGVSQGLLTAFESLASQAFGSGNRRRVGILYQRAVIVLAIAFVPVRWKPLSAVAAKSFPVRTRLAVMAARFLLCGGTWDLSCLHASSRQWSCIWRKNTFVGYCTVCFPCSCLKPRAASFKFKALRGPCCMYPSLPTACTRCGTGC
jgi:hypothetical protein